MCGITGVFSFSGKPNQHQKFVRWSMDNMKRRGPDSDGFLSTNSIAFGFRRLAIRDTSEKANQPMYSEGLRHVLVFNGELYNTDFLKSKLPKFIEYKTSSDTEVLLHSLIHLGSQKTLSLLDGIFAFAFYESDKDELTLARDRCGTKPLYYGISNNVLIFCSEYNHILCHEDFTNASINVDALGQYLQLGYVPDGEAIYKNTFLLPHGHSLTIKRDKTISLNSFYDYTWRKQEHNINESDLLNEILGDSVRSQLVSDVPIGVFQSGGIDSSLVSYHAFKNNKDIESFTIGVNDQIEMDEANDAREFSKILGIENNLRNIEIESLTDLIDQNTEAFSEPFADYSSLPTLLLSQFAKEKITVALSGDGGDELFWGYPRNIQTINKLPSLHGGYGQRIFSFLKNRISKNKLKIPFETLEYSSFVDFSYQKTFITGSKVWFNEIYQYKPVLPYFVQNLKDDIGKTPNLSEIDLMNILRKIEFDMHLQRVLIKVDRASLYHSLEVRVPLLSNNMLKASLGFYYSDCINNSKGKMPLRNVLNNCIPSEIRNLPKKGFTVPIDKWINGSLNKIISTRLLNIPTDFQPYFKEEGIIQLLKSCQTQKNGWLVWALFTLFEWADNTKQKKGTYNSNGACQVLPL